MKGNEWMIFSEIIKDKEGGKESDDEEETNEEATATGTTKSWYNLFVSVMVINNMVVQIRRCISWKIKIKHRLAKLITW